MRTCLVCGQPKVEHKVGRAICPECRRVTPKDLIARKKYRQSVKGKATSRAYGQRPDVKQKRLLYGWSERNKLNSKSQRARFNHSIKGRLARVREYARQKGAIVPSQRMTAEDWQEILEAHKYRCHYCHKKKILTMDHVIPLNKGGKHVKENIVPACRSCNCSKKDKIIRLL